MKEVNLINLKDAANRLLFDMSDSEYQTLLAEFDVIKKQMEIMANYKEVSKLAPMIFPFPCETDTLREDVAKEPTEREIILKNAKSKLAGQIKLPKVLS